MRWCGDRCGGGGGDCVARGRCGRGALTAQPASLVASDTAGDTLPPARTGAGTPSAAAAAAAVVEAFARFFFALPDGATSGGGVFDLTADASSRSNAVRGAPVLRGAGPRQISHVTRDGGLLNVHAPHDQGGCAAPAPSMAREAALGTTVGGVVAARDPECMNVVCCLHSCEPKSAATSQARHAQTTRLMLCGKHRLHGWHGVEVTPSRM